MLSRPTLFYGACVRKPEDISHNTFVFLYLQDELPPVCTDGSYVGFDPQGRLLALNLFDGLLKVDIAKKPQLDTPYTDASL